MQFTSSNYSLNSFCLTAVSFVMLAMYIAGCDGADDGSDPSVLRSTDDPGCGAMIDASVPESSEDGSVAEGEPDDAGLSEVDASISPTPDKPSIFASVTANGTGCPLGKNVAASFTPSGDSLLVTFEGFEAVVDKNKSVAVQDCQLGIKLKSHTGMSYALEESYHEGYAFLARGQTARAQMRAYFQGRPDNDRTITTDLQGPYDDSFILRNTASIADAKWSPCGLDRMLNIATVLRMQNAAKDEATDGYISVSKFGGVKLAWKRCN